ncbi:MAG: Gfo/Idh/MocA family oxidoreductase [Streptococcaceae bacterium]|jgi:virulence factor|nr:Gfo/Idh/MocA family oxidoreductase [Streptococcaceae bacterium]
MKIGIIGGTGSIAAKAYLPVYAELQDQHEFTIYSRELTKAEATRKKYNFAGATQILSNLDLSEMVFIHAATSAHYEIVKHFLKQGVHVVLDKPISENLTETKELLDLAAAENLLFIIALNRRFVPATQQLKAIPEKTFVKITKNVSPNDKSLTFNMYDMFIHPLDTLIYLLDDEILDYHTQLAADNDRLLRAVVHLQTPTSSGVASMNLESGAFMEEFTVEAKGETCRVSDLAEIVKYEGLKVETGHFHGWNSTPYERGFDSIVKASIKAVEKFDGTNRQELMQQLHQSNVIKSHEIISEMLENYKHSLI